MRGKWRQWYIQECMQCLSRKDAWNGDEERICRTESKEEVQSREHEEGMQFKRHQDVDIENRHVVVACEDLHRDKDGEEQESCHISSWKDALASDTNMACSESKVGRKESGQKSNAWQSLGRESGTSTPDILAKPQDTDDLDNESHVQSLENLTSTLNELQIMITEMQGYDNEAVHMSREATKEGKKTEFPSDSGGSRPSMQHSQLEDSHTQTLNSLMYQLEKLKVEAREAGLVVDSEADDVSNDSKG